MSDDWRLTVRVGEEGRTHLLARRLEASELEHELDTAFSDRVVVSSGGPELFCYAATREQAEAAERLVRRLAAGDGFDTETALHRWHPEAEAWEDPDIPLPVSEPERAAEHAERLRAQREEAAAQGFPSFEVRVECRTERACAEFARRLEDEGLAVVRRGRFLLVGAADEDRANEIAARCHREAPEGSSVVAEGTLPAVLTGAPFNPFVVFGGLAG